MNVLGINCVFHESSAAVVVDGVVLAEVEEERFNRVKHAKPARVDNAHHLPAAAIAHCLRVAGLEAAAIDVIACSFDPGIRRKAFSNDPWGDPGGWGSEAGEKEFLRSLERIPAAVSELLAMDVTDRFRWVPHHMAHGASTYYSAGDDKAAVLVVDGIGEFATAMLAGGYGKEIRLLEELHYPDSVGFVWEKLSSHLGFSEYDACKVMGLAAYGDATRYSGAFEELTGGDGPLRVRSDLFRFRLDDFAALEKLLGQRRGPQDPLGQRHADVAAALQHWTDQTILNLAGRLYDLHPASTLCYAGGVALNCSTNWVLKEKGPFSRVHIPPAPHDGGTAAGAALWSCQPSLPGAGPSETGATVYSGPAYTETEITAAFAAAGLIPRRSTDIAAEVARRVADGQIVGWFQGAMEIGPRALGNRSLIADPRDPGMRELLNRKVKHREDFRPFAPSVLEERARDWFELGRDSESYRYMLYACPARPERAARIPAVLHVDGTSRIQTVSAAQNPLYHRMISCFEGITGVPMVLNTSFNDSEPIVCSPEDALATFAGTRIDAVAIGDHIAERHTAEEW